MSEISQTPEGWTSSSLGHFLVGSEYGISESLHDRGEIPVLRMMNFRDGRAVVDDLKFSNSPEAKGLLLSPGDVLFNRTNSIDHVGRTGMWRGELLCASFASYLVRLNPGDEHLVPELLNYWLNWSYTQLVIRRFATPGVHQVNINPTNLKKTAATFPSALLEQRRIAKILDTLDEAIRKTEQVIAKLQQMKQGLLHDLLTRGIDKNGELRDPRRHPEQFKDSELGRIPKEWEVRPLQNWVHPQSQITYGIVQAGPHLPGGIPYIRTGDMKWKRLSRKGLLCTSRRIANSYQRSEVRTGDLVYAIRATVGKVLPVPPELDGANLTQGTARIAPGPEVNGSFLLWALRSHSAMRQVEAVQKGTTFSEITLAQLRLLLVACPSELGEQEEIASRLNALSKSIDEEEREHAKLRTLKQGLMDDLLTGRVRVNVKETAG